MKTSQIILLAVIAVFVVVLAINFSGSSSQYADFATARESGDYVHVVGTWVEREKASYDADHDLFRFAMQDTSGQVSWVVYNDPQPQNFDHAERVVIVGKQDGEAFHAEKIIMKCPSKYEETTVKDDRKTM